MASRKYVNKKNILYFDPQIKSNDTYWRSKNPITLGKIKDSINNKFIPDEIWEVDVNVSTINERDNPSNFIAYNNFLNPDKNDIERITWPSKYLAQLPKKNEQYSAEEAARRSIDKITKDFAEWFVEELYFEPKESDIKECSNNIKEMFRQDLDRHIINAIEIKIEEIPYEIDSDDIPIYSEPMKPIWTGIEDLQITKDFYKWLIVNHKRDVPSYLKSYYNENENVQIITPRRKKKISKPCFPIVKKLGQIDVRTLEKYALND